MALKPPIKPTAEFTRNRPPELPGNVTSVEELNELIESADADPQATPGAIVLLPSDVRVLSTMLGLNIFTVDQLMQRVAKMTTIDVGGRVITLSPALLDRLKTRAVRRPLPEYIESEVIRLLNGAVGI